MHVQRNEPLTAAQFVERHRLGVGALAVSISSFIDPTPRVTIARATEYGDEQLLQHVMHDHYAHGSTRITDRHYISHVVTTALEHAVRRENDVALLESLLAFAVSMDAVSADGYLCGSTDAYSASEDKLGSTSRAIDAAIKLGKVYVLEWLVQHCKHVEEWCTESLYSAAANGHIPMLEWLLARSDDDYYNELRLSNQVAGSAAEGAQLHVLEWIWRNHNDVASERDFFGIALTGAARCGNVAIVEWIHDRAPKLSEYFATSALQTAIAYGHVDVVKCLYAHGYRLDPTVFCYPMRAHVGLRDVQWLAAHDFETATQQLFTGAAAYGDADVIEWLWVAQSSDAMHAECARGLELAAKHGHVDVVALLLSMCQSASVRFALIDAAKNGHVDVVKLVLASSRCADGDLRYTAEDVEDAVMHVVAHGDLDTARLLHARRVSEWSDQPVWYSMVEAAARGHLDGVQWIVANSVQQHVVSSVRAAASNGHLDVLQWLLERFDLDIRSQGSMLLDAAAANGHLDVVQWLLEQIGSTSDLIASAIQTAATHNHLHVVKWLHERNSCGAGCTPAAMDSAAAGGHFELLLYLHGHCSSGCTVKALTDADSNGYMDVVSWIMENYPHVSDAMGSFGDAAGIAAL